MSSQDPAPSADSSVGAPPAAPVAGSAGRGVLFIAFAKLYFMLAGLALQIGLPSIVSTAMFGAFVVVSGVVSAINNVMVTGSIQTVSRFIAQTPERARQVEHAGLRLHLFLGLPLALAFIAGAPLIAGILHDPSKTMPLRVAGLIIAGYSFYAVMVGTANGLRQFHKQAGLDITFATLRIAGILGMAAAGLSLSGIVAGWVSAVGVILLVASIWVGLPRLAGAPPMPLRPLAVFFVGVALYLILFNLLMVTDTVLLKRLVTEHYREVEPRMVAGLAAHLPWATQITGFRYDPSHLADVQVAYYGAAQTLARLSYQAIIAATFVVFPLVSRSTFEGDRETTRRYIHVTMRYSLVFSMAIAVVMAALPEPLLEIPYPGGYAQLGGPALAFLALGNVAFSLFSIAGTILNGAGKTLPAIVAALVTLVVAGVGNLIAIPMCDPGREVLMVAASVTGGAMLLGALLSGWMLWRTVGAFLPLLSAVRVIAATAIALVAGRLMPRGGAILTLVEAAAVAVVFLTVLVLSRELGKKDLSAIAAVRRSRGSAPAAD